MSVPGLDVLRQQEAERYRRWQEEAASAWYNLPKPRRWHRCRAVQEAAMDGRLIERCACGGIRIDGGRWMERNR